ncbi:hypothetical protein STRDD04_01314 [Streptococcus sp. DD04]|nr:hypothetical protein STRDD04_01314 [Streptococcus sp. DD04]
MPSDFLLFSILKLSEFLIQLFHYIARRKAEQFICLKNS